MENRFGEDMNRETRLERKDDRVPVSAIFVSVFWMFVVLFVSFLIAEGIATVFGWIVKPDAIVKTKDLSRNFYLVYPLYGLIGAGCMFVLRYFFAQLMGYRDGFRTKTRTKQSHMYIEYVIAYVVFEFLALYFFWDVLPSWFLGGSIAAVLHIFNASNVFETVFEGSVEILDLTVYFWWIMAILEIGFAVLSFIVTKKAREKGEKNGIAEREKQLQELEEEHQEIMSRK